MAVSLKSLLALSTLSLTLPMKAYAHMEMVWPIPFNSKYDAAYYGGKVDYTNTAPLLADGSNYPCKHYQLEGLDKVQATYTAGQSYNISIGGSASHGGGSCQISLSYDNGKTFQVIKSMEGGCPLKSNWDFTVPASAPSSGSALLAWTWFNLIGNREMYMNCARVSIGGGSNAKQRRWGVSRRQSAFYSLPENFACNIGNGCVTIEGQDVVFPNPGNSVENGSDAGTGKGTGFTITGATPTGNAFSTVAGSGGSSAAASTAAAATASSAQGSSSTSSSSSSSAPSVSGGVFATIYSTTTSTSSAATSTSVTVGPAVSATFNTASSSPSSATGSSGSSVATTLLTVTSSTTTAASAAIPTSSPSSAPTTPTVVSGSCTPGEFTCNSTSTWSQCVPSTSSSGTYIYMGPVAAGMECINGTIVRSESESCTPTGVLLCEGESAFAMCVFGGRVDMGPVAPGTKCMDGVIFPA